MLRRFGRAVTWVAGLRFKGLDLNLLVALDALLEEKSVAKAAKRLFRSPSAVSGALASLRAHFQDELLVRFGRRLVLTPIGESLADPVRRLLLQIDQTLDVSRRFDPATSRRRFTICISEQDADLVMPAVVRRALAEAPQIRLDMVAASPASAAMVEHDLVDLIFAGQGSTSPQFDAELAYEDDYVVLTSAETSAPLSAEAFLARGRVACWFGRAEALSYAETQMQRMGAAARIEVMAPSLRAIPDFLVGADRIALVNRALADSWVRRFALVAHPAPVPLKPLRVMLQSHAARAQDAGVAWLKGLIREGVAAAYRPVTA